MLLLREWLGLNPLVGDFSKPLITDWLLLSGGGQTWGSMEAIGRENLANQEAFRRGTCSWVMALEVMNNTSVIKTQNNTNKKDSTDVFLSHDLL